MLSLSETRRSPCCIPERPPTPAELWPCSPRGPRHLADEVEDLGWFVEIEVMVQEQEAIEPARQKIETLAGQLGLHQPEVQSYLRMVLAEKMSNQTGACSIWACGRTCANEMGCGRRV